MIYKFIKETFTINKYKYTSWYIDLPEYIEMGGSKSALAMVAGADTFLDILAGDNNSVTLDLQLTQKYKSDPEYVLLKKVPKKKLLRYVTGGADYILSWYNGEEINHKMWLCNVTKYVFGHFPKEIYFKQINEKL